VALLIFPPNPTNGQLFPISPAVDQSQYKWSSADLTWRLLGTASGVTPGVYCAGDTYAPRITVDVLGRVTAVQCIELTGFVRINSTTAYNGYIWPLTDGNPGEVLATDGTGGLAWIPGGGGGGGGGSVTFVGAGTGLSVVGGGAITTTGTIVLDPATATTLGGVIPDGTTITVSPTGAISSAIAGYGIIKELTAFKNSIPSFPLPPTVGTAPNEATDGSFYFDSTLGSLFYRYDDGVTSQWVEIVGSGGGGGGGGGGTVTLVNTGTGLTGGPITGSGTVSLSPATTSVLGGVIPDGTTITVSPTGVITAVSAGVGTLQTVTNNGATTTNTIRLFDSVTTNEAITLDPQNGVISILPQALGEPGLYLSPNGATIGNSVGSFRSAGLFPCAVNFNGSAGASLQTAQDGFPVQLWAGGTNLIGSPQVSVTGTATTIANKLIASGLSYPTTDGTAGQVLSTNGSGTLSWITPGSGSVGTLQTVTDNGATTTNAVSVRGLTVTDVSGGTAATITNLGAGTFRGGIVAGNTSSGTGGAIVAGDFRVQDASYQRFSVDSNTGLVRIGNGNAGAGGSPGLEIYAAGSPTPTVDIEGSTGGILTLGTITIDGTNNGNYPLIIKSGSGQQAIRIAGRTSDGRSYIDFTNPTQTLSYGYIQSDPTGLFFGVGVGQVITLSTATTTITNNLQVAGSANVTSGLTVAGVSGAGYQLQTTGNEGIGVSNGSVIKAEIKGSTGNAFFAGSLQASGLSYPTADGTANQVLSTNGSGTLGWTTTAKVVATPGSSAAGGNDNEISFDAAGNFYFYKGGQWWKVAGVSF
jgi:hypothetical protein